jgi:hypothetical protein
MSEFKGCNSLPEFAIAPTSPASSASAIVPCGRHELIVCEHDGVHRQEIEHLVRMRFAEQHGARVCTFMPTMFAMRNDAGQLCSVAGFRSAALESLFLEQYLSEPVEQAIASVSHQAVERHEIVEVGNLAGINCRSAVRLVLQLPQLLLSRGHQWIVFTATGAVRQLLSAYAAPLIELAPAEVSRLGRGQDHWGSYYQRDPRVMAGYLADGLAMRRERRKTRV